MLARRELSESQVRQRLARRHHSQDDIDAAVERLRNQRAIDDERVAETIARNEVSVKRRGERRVRTRIAQAGIAPALARRAAREASEAVDPEAQIEAALAKRLRRRTQIADEREFRRLFRYLAGQGFEPDRILRVLKSRSNRKDWPD